jgi:glycine cleavage system H protein
VTEVNDSLSDSPEKINEDPYGDGWLVKVKLSSGGEHETLLTAAEYQKLLDR